MHEVIAGRGGRRATGEDGDTLVEILIALMILSITVVSLVGAFSTSIVASSQYRGLSVSDTVLRTVSEQVVGEFQQGNAYQSCATASQYTTALAATALTVPAPYKNAQYAATISNVEYWNGLAYVASCPANSTTPQLLTITLTGPLSVPEQVSVAVGGSGQIVPPDTVQLTAPTNVVVSTPSSGSGGLTVTFTGSSNAPTGITQSYTVEACINALMTLGCAPPANDFLSGDTLSGLVPGTPYWVTVFANPSPWYLASATTEAGPGNSSGTASLPIVTSVSSSTTTAGALVVTYTPAATAPSGDTYTVMACQDLSMSTSCQTQANFVSGSQFTGLLFMSPADPYYVDVSADPSGTYLGATSFVFSTPVMATFQLPQPTLSSVASSTLQTGALVVTFNSPANAPSTQSYTVTACTNSGMTNGCVSQASYISGNQFTGLQSGTFYYVNVTAMASPGYLAATSTTSLSSTEATTQFTQPSITWVKPGSTGTITVKYKGSSNAITGETYTLLACTDALMTKNCATNPNYVSAAQFGSSLWTSGSTVYVTITANAATGYLASVPSAQDQGLVG